MESLSIVFVTNNYAPYSGGVVSSINAFYDGLLSQGHDVTIITLDFLVHQHKDERSVVRLICPIKFRYKHNHMAVPFFAHAQMRHILKKINPDIVHVHHPFLLGTVACTVAQRLQKPVVFTYHTLYEEYLHYAPLPSKVLEPFLMHHMHAFCSKMSAIIAPSRAVEQVLKERGIVVPITLLPSPIDHLFFTQRMQLKQYQQCRRFKLVTVSRFTKEKNIPFLLDMFAQLNAADYELTLVGFGYELDALKKYAYERLNLSPDVVQFVERPSKQELVSYYREADLFIYASQTETQGLVMLEAMAAGTPVVALQGPGQQDFVINGVNGYLVQNHQSMVHHITHLRANSLLLQGLGVGAAATAEQYTAHELTQKLVGVYRSLLLPTL